MLTQLRAEVPLHSWIKVFTVKGDEIVGELIEVTDSYIRLITAPGLPAMLSGQLVGGYCVLKLSSVSEKPDIPVSVDEVVIPACSESNSSSSTDQQNDAIDPIEAPLSLPLEDSLPASANALREPEVKHIEHEVLEGSPEVKNDPEGLVDEAGPSVANDCPEVQLASCSAQPHESLEQQFSSECPEKTPYLHLVTVRACLPDNKTESLAETSDALSDLGDDTDNGNRKPCLHQLRLNIPLSRLDTLSRHGQKFVAHRRLKNSGGRTAHPIDKSLISNSNGNQRYEVSRDEAPVEAQIIDTDHANEATVPPEQGFCKGGSKGEEKIPEPTPDSSAPATEIHKDEKETVLKRECECHASLHKMDRESVLGAPLLETPPVEISSLTGDSTSKEPTPEQYLSRFGLTIDFYHASAIFSLPVADIHTPFPGVEFDAEQSSAVASDWRSNVHLVRVGKVLHDPKRLETALRFFRHLQEQFPASPATDYNAGSVALELNLCPEAQERLERSYRRRPDPDALVNLASAWVKLNEPGRAYATLAKLLDDERDLADVDIWASFVYTARSVKDFGLLRLLVEKLSEPGNEATQPDRVVITLKALVVALAELGERTRAEQLAELLEKEIDLSQIRATIQEVLPSVPKRTRIQKCKYQSYIHNILATPLSGKMEAAITTQKDEGVVGSPMGFISAKKENWPYGFIKGNKGGTYYFQLDYVSDIALREKLTNFDPDYKIFVEFEVKPPLPGGNYERAVNVREWYTGDHIPQPLSPMQVSPVPRSERPRVPMATAHAHSSGSMVQSGDTIETRLLHQINDRPGVITPIKTLVDYYQKIGNYDAAIKLLKEQRYQLGDIPFVDGLLLTLYFAQNDRHTAMEHLESVLRRCSSPDERSTLLLTAGKYLTEAGELREADATLKRILNENPVSSDTVRLLLCHYEKTNRRHEGLDLISKHHSVVSNPALQAILTKETEALASGHDSTSAEIQPDNDATILSDFCLFFLEKADFSHFRLEGSVELDGERRRYSGSRGTAKRDIKGIEDRAKKTGTATIKSRAGLYLLAARVAYDAGLGLEEIVKYLYRSFRSFGDEILEDERKNIDSAMAFYFESLVAFDALPRGKCDEKLDEPLTILVKFLRAIVEERYTSSHGTPKVGDALDFIFGLDPAKYERIFDHVSYLIPGSQLAAEEILKYIADKPTRLEEAKMYLRKKGVSGTDTICSYERLNSLWRTYNINRNDVTRRLIHELKDLQSSTLFQGQLRQAMERIDPTEHALLFDLDRDRLESLKKVLSTLEHFYAEEGFEERERLLQLGMQDCTELRREIGEIPTSFAIEHVLPVIDRLHEWAELSQNELYRTSTPKLTIRLRKDDERFSPDYDRVIGVQIVFANAPRCSPIESLEYTVLEDVGALYHPLMDKERLTRSLKGGDSEIRLIKLRIDEKALVERTFTLQVTAQFRSRSQEMIETVNASLPVRLYPAEEFKALANPYVYANSGTVEDPSMFFGRDELISNIITTIRTSPQSNCYVIYGQKRSGKTSILYHIKRSLSDDPSTIVIDLSNIAVYFSSTVPIFTQILSDILAHISEEIRTRFPNTPLFDLVAEIPGRSEFFADPAPFLRFKEIMGRITTVMRQGSDVSCCQVVVLMDEFSYLYEQILQGKIPRDFMKQWKALLQENYFKAIIAGQDMMPKFKMAFPNEFGTSQDERITYLNPEAARKLIEDPIRIGGPTGESRYVEKSVEYVLNLTAGSPYYIQIICSRIVELMNSTQSLYVSQYEVSRVRDELVLGTNRLGQDKFENLYNSGDTSSDAIADNDCLRVLKDIAINSRNGACPRQKITCKTEIDVEMVLADLLSRDVISKTDGDLFTIQVGLFREWLLENSISVDEKVESVDNPFSDYGIAVSGTGFIGRNDALNEINQRVVSASRPGNLAIIGLPRIGKTSVSRQAVVNFGPALIQNKRIPVEIDISIFSDVYEFFKALLLESNAAIQRHHVPSPGIDSIGLKIEEIAGDSVELKLGIQKYFKEVRRAGFYLILFLDEFDKIVDIFKENPAWIQLLRDLASNPDYPVRLVTLSRREISELEHKIGDGGRSVSNLHGIFQTHFLRGFFDADLNAFFNKLSHARVHLEDEERRQMVDLCGPFPYYLNAAAYRLVEGKVRGDCTDLLGAIETSQPELIENYQHICQLLDEKEILNPFLAYLFNEENSFRSQEFDLLVRYGLVRLENGQYICASRRFYQYLRTILPVIHLRDRLGQAERLLRNVVTEHLRTKFGEDWVNGLEEESPIGREIMDQCRRYRYTAEQKHQNLSPNLIDYSSTTNLFKLVQLYWDTIAPKFYFDTSGSASADILVVWKTVADDVIAARGIHAHNNEHLLTDEQTQQYANSCEHLIRWIAGDPDRSGIEMQATKEQTVIHT